ncbi:MAG: hypothetical protein MK101_02265 [Phycisphaerales bacterium]|nr:hypothetical protein [Phycisphaerales bacterium]
MSDLRKLNLLKPEQEWSGEVPGSAVHGPCALLWAGCGLGGCVLMVIGDGAWATWLGVALFGLALIGFTLLNTRAIRRRASEDGQPSAAKANDRT